LFLTRTRQSDCHPWQRSEEGVARVNRVASICLGALALTALAIILVDQYPAPNDYTEPVLQIPMLALLALFGVGLILFALSEKGDVRGH
jgi:hypothetical protein